MKVHPIADLFPMMPEDELAELAEDIKANGLIHPIITDDQGQLIDGRNRMKACKLAGVEPSFEKLDGQNPVVYILSANIGRRNITKSQRVMLVAKAYPKPAEHGRGKKCPETGHFSRQRLSEARKVLEHSENLADSVIKGTLSLDEALDRVKKEQERSDSDEAKLSELRECAPDLHDRIGADKQHGGLSVAEAFTLLEKRDEEQAKAREVGQQVVQRFEANIESLFHVEKAIAAGGKPVTTEFVAKLRNAVKEFEQCLKNQG
jgi:hypothetical protein